MNRRSACFCCLIAALLIFSAGPLLAQPRADVPDESEPRLHDDPNPSTDEQIRYGEPIHGGTVIVRGQVLEGPYRIGQRGGEILINGVTVAVLRGAGHGKGPGRSGSKSKQLMATLEQNLYYGSTLIVFDDLTRLCIEEEEEATYFLEALVEAESVEARIQATLEYTFESDGGYGSRIPTSQWRTALAAFEATDGLMDYLQDWGAIRPGSSWH